jgi:hypothetical protein
MTTSSIVWLSVEATQPSGMRAGERFLVVAEDGDVFIVIWDCGQWLMPVWSGERLVVRAVRYWAEMPEVPKEVMDEG